MYVSKKNKCYLPRTLFRFLFNRYEDLRSDYTVFHILRFTTDRPGFVPGPGKTSRIGASIVVFGGGPPSWRK